MAFPDAAVELTAPTPVAQALNEPTAPGPGTESPPARATHQEAPWVALLHLYYSTIHGPIEAPTARQCRQHTKRLSGWRNKATRLSALLGILETAMLGIC